MIKLVSINGEVTYSGNGVFGINFNLYGYEHVKPDETKEEIQRLFTDLYEEKIKQALVNIGLKYVKLHYFSPREYNFKGDSLDLVISDVIDKKKLSEYVIEYKDEINKRLAKNVSYDGYIAHTVNSTDEELYKMDANDEDPKVFSYEPDVIVLGTILQNLVDFSEFNIHDYFIEYDEDEDEG